MTYFMIILGVIALMFGSIAWYEHHENSLLAGQVATAQADLATAKGINSANDAVVKKMDAISSQADKILGSLDESQLTNQKTQQTLLEKVHDALPSLPSAKCATVDSHELAAIIGMQQQYANHVGAATAGQTKSPQQLTSATP